MFEQKAIAIPKDWGMQALADALEVILNQLATEGWNSRMFQLGPKGVLIVAHRNNFTEFPELLVTDKQDEENDFLNDFSLDTLGSLRPVTRQILERIFELVSSAPLDQALDTLPNAVVWVTSMYSSRMVQEVLGELQAHYREAYKQDNHFDDPRGYSQFIASVIQGLRQAVVRRAN